MIGMDDEAMWLRAAILNQWAVARGGSGTSEYHHPDHNTSSSTDEHVLLLLASWHSLGCSDIKRTSFWNEKVGYNPAPVKAPKRVLRKYDTEYIKFGFIIAGSHAELKAQCVECGEILSHPRIFSPFYSHVEFFSNLFGQVFLRFFLTIRSGPSITKGW